jgi:fused signal recognition particle receptor
VARCRLTFNMQLTPEFALVGAAVIVGLLLTTLGLTRLRRRSKRRAKEVEVARSAPAPSAPPRATLETGLTRTRQGLLARLRDAWGTGKDTEARLADLEDVLIAADVGVKATQQLLAQLRPRANELSDSEALRRALADQMRAVLTDGGQPGPAVKPHVIVVAGVNGVGKTTTIGKLAYRYRAAGQQVLVVAADTFRAAAIEQLQLWAERVGADCVHHQSGSDPAAVAHDGIAAAVARGTDVVIVDTAGRLHVKQHLIEELKKVVRIIARQLPGAPHETLLVIDATTGQNAINQARVFQEALQLTGIVLTKLDGTAKGGAIFAVRAELGIPIRYVGLGEKPEDLQPFDAGAFIDALLAAD